MRVIKPGNIKHSQFVGKCRNCGCEVEAEENEVAYHGGYEPREPPCYKLPCPTPQCHFSIYMEKQSEGMKR